MIVFIPCAICGWLGTEYLIAAMDIEGIDLIFTGMMDIIHLKFKIMGLLGLIGVATVIGVSLPQRLLKNPYYRLLILIIPTLAASAVALYGKRWVMLIVVAIGSFHTPLGVSIRDIRLEMVPLTGLVTALVIALTMVVISRRNQRQI